MNKRIIYLVIVLFSLLMPLNVSATSCADVSKEISDYKSYKTELSNLDCKKDTDSQIVSKCNNLALKKNLIVSDLYNTLEYKNSCSQYEKDIKKIIEENKDNCGKILDGEFGKYVSTLFNLFYILGPIFVILFSSIDYTKSVVSSDPNLLRKTNVRFAKRLASVLLLFLVPWFVNFILDIEVTGKQMSGNAYVCQTDTIQLKKNYQIKYVPKEDDNDSDEEDDSLGVTAHAEGKKGLKTDATGFKIRQSKPTMADAKYFDPALGNTGQCVWYVRGRAIEALSTAKMNDSKRKKAIATINKPAGESAFMFWTNPIYRNLFASSNKLEKPKQGAIIVFNRAPGHQHGHVAFVEKVHKNGSGKVTSIDYTEGWTSTGSCPNRKMSCVQWKYNKNASLNSVKKNAMGEPFLGYIYLFN